MSPPDLGAIIDAQIEAARSSLARKGQEAGPKAGRLQLQLQLDLARIKSMRPGAFGTVRTCVINTAYPPSIAPLSELKPVSITELRLETHHIGKVLIVRTFGIAGRMVSVHNVIEDVHGNVDRLSVYNLHPLLTPQEALPQHQVFAIKEPYYKATVDGGYTVRVDHPSDLVRLRTDSTMMPLEFIPRLIELDVTPQSYKNDGNARYRDKDYHMALEKYSCGIKTCSEKETLVQKDLYRNRSIINLLLGRYEPAMADAYASLVQDVDGIDQEKAKAYNTKALFRAGRANYELGRFEEAERNFKDASKLTPDDADAMRELARVAHRLAEIADGSHNVRSMIDRVGQGKLRLDHASYTRNVTVHTAGSHGRGLFATRAVKAGQVILFEKAFQICFPRDDGNDFYSIININTKRGQVGSQATLLFHLVDKLRHNPMLAQRFLGLYDGGHGPKYAARQVDRCAVIDAFEVQAILEHNAFATDSTCEHELHQPYGIWITAAHINHACNGNAYRTFFGDMIVITATRDIAENEEITMPYRMWDADHAKGTESLQKIWGFTCDCSLCVAEQKTSIVQRRDRQALWTKMHILLTVHRITKSYMPTQRIIREVADLHSKLARTYDSVTFKGLPRLALIFSSLWLAQAYANPPTIRRCRDRALEALRNLGFEVTIMDGSAKIGREHSIAYIGAVDAAVHLQLSYVILDQRSMSETFRVFSQEMWRILHGNDMRGFNERYKI